MRLKKILSHRRTELWPSWQLVYEWEDILSIQLDLPIAHVSKTYVILFKIFRRLGLSSLVQWIDLKGKETSGQSLYFVMNADKYFNYPLTKNTVPVIIDFYLSKQDLPEFYAAYKNCECVLISSLEAFNFLKNNNCPLEIHHFPLSLPDKYKLYENSTFEKKINVLFAGRRNPILWDYVKKYAEENPDFEYVYQTNQNGILLYESNKKGILGEFNSREGYINLLRSAKISFYATPGMDEIENRTNGFNQVTPRFFELLSSGCLLIGRYPSNPDTEFYNLNEFCPGVHTYSEFKTLMESLSTKSYSKNDYIIYLNKHYTSMRAEQLKSMNTL